jgi:hypothetical protein
MLITAGIARMCHTVGADGRGMFEAAGVSGMRVTTAGP